jgi:hypothetical protein
MNEKTCKYCFANLKYDLKISVREKMMRQELLFGCMLPSRGSMKGKSSGSARWLRRQLNDPLVKQAQREGLRSRAAFKLRELNTVRTVLIHEW